MYSGRRMDDKKVGWGNVRSSKSECQKGWIKRGSPTPWLRSPRGGRDKSWRDPVAGLCCCGVSIMGAGSGDLVLNAIVVRVGEDPGSDWSSRVRLRGSCARPWGSTWASPWADDEAGACPGACPGFGVVKAAWEGGLAPSPCSIAVCCGGQWFGVRSCVNGCVFVFAVQLFRYGRHLKTFRLFFAMGRFPCDKVRG